VGKLERTFDFCDRDERTHGRSSNRSRLRIASAANLVDTFTARRTIARHRVVVHRLESYIEAGTLGRIGYQLASLFTPVAAIPWVDELARLPTALLPEGPTPHERATERATVVLEIEDPIQHRVINWCWHTPNPYTFTAQVVIEIARQVASGKRYGWLTPSDVLQPTRADLTARDGYLRGCHLDSDPDGGRESAS
jgi:hypothetical protein